MSRIRAWDAAVEAGSGTDQRVCMLATGGARRSQPAPVH